MDLTAKLQPLAELARHGQPRGPEVRFEPVLTLEAERARTDSGGDGRRAKRAAPAEVDGIRSVESIIER
jgi:hypothetical protein